MRNYEELRVWNDAHQLVLDTYRAAGRLPRNERYELSSQLRRAAVSVAANIAEGSGRRSQADFRRFLDIAAGSTSEVQYYAEVAKDLEMLDQSTCSSLRSSAIAIRRQLYALTESLKEPD